MFLKATERLGWKPGWHPGLWLLDSALLVNGSAIEDQSLGSKGKHTLEGQISLPWSNMYGGRQKRLAALRVRLLDITSSRGWLPKITPVFSRHS